MEIEIKGYHVADTEKGTSRPKLIFHIGENRKQMMVSICIHGKKRVEYWFEPDDFEYLGEIIKTVKKCKWICEDPWATPDEDQEEN